MSFNSQDGHFVCSYQVGSTLLSQHSILQHTCTCRHWQSCYNPCICSFSTQATLIFHAHLRILIGEDLYTLACYLQGRNAEGGEESLRPFPGCRC